MKVFSYPRKIDDWRRKTAKLTLEERGVYSELIDWYYCTGAELPSSIDELCRMIGATKRSEREAVLRIVSNPEYFVVNENRLMQKTCDETLSFIAEKSSSASKSAEYRWSKNRDLRDANALQTKSEGNANYKLKTKEIEIGLNDFEEFWEAYPRHVAKPTALAAYTKARKGGTAHEAVITGARRYADECRGKEQRFVAHPATWLNAGRWDDAPGANRDSVNGGKPNGNAGKDRQQPQSRAHILAEFISELPEDQRNPRGARLFENEGCSDDNHGEPVQPERALSGG